MTLYILGAGATRGASFVGERDKDGQLLKHCLPPLNGDFFTQLQRISSEKHRPLVDGVISDVFELFGPNFKGDMELVFTTFEHTLRMAEAIKGNRRFKPEELRLKRDRLLSAIAAILEESVCEGASQIPCKFHNRLVEKMKAEDAIISFNYDCTIDYALKNCSSGIWNPNEGYCLPKGRGRDQIKGEENWRKIDLNIPSETVRLLKLHGSLNFKIITQNRKNKLIHRAELKRHPYTKRNGSPKLSIIPPESSKAYDKGAFRSLWVRAAKEIHRAKRIVVIGYSFPPTDLHASSLFRINTPESLSSLVIVNRDPEARKRTRDIMRAGIGPETKVHSFDTFKEFSECPKLIWHR